MTHQVADLYDSWSGYQWTRLDAFPCEFHIHLSSLLESLPPASRVLDVGAGPGRYAIELARAGHRVTIADISPAMLEMARRHVGEAGFEIGRVDAGGGVEAVLELEASDLGRFEAASFDAIVALGPFYHLTAESARQRAAAEAARCLRSGGRLFAAFKPRTYWLSMALHTFVTDPGSPVAHFEHLEKLLDTGRLEKLKSPQLKQSWFCRLDEIEGLFAPVGISRLELLASSGVVAAWSRLETWRALGSRDRELRRRVFELVRRTASDPHVLGMSDQVLFIGERDDR